TDRPRTRHSGTPRSRAPRGPGPPPTTVVARPVRRPRAGRRPEAPSGNRRAVQTTDVPYRGGDGPVTSGEERPPRALLAGASRRWVRVLPWAVAFVLSVALLPTTIVVLTADYGLNGAVAAALAVPQAAPPHIAVSLPLRALYVVVFAVTIHQVATLGPDFAERLP